MQDACQVAQRHRASNLNLLAAAIILRNTTCLQRAVDHLRKQGHHPAPGDLAHLSPLGWEHINLAGDHQWIRLRFSGQTDFRRFGPVCMTSPQRRSVL